MSTCKKTNDTGMKTIPLTQGYYAFVDDEDYDDLMQFKWHILKMRNCYYAKRGCREGGKVRNITMQAHILGVLKPHGRAFQIDHKNGNGLDNRRENIRICSYSQNQMNKVSSRGKTSKYKGVNFCSKRGYISRIKLNYKEIYIGSFKLEKEAALAYDKKAKELFGEFARLNFPEKIN